MLKIKIIACAVLALSLAACSGRPAPRAAVYPECPAIEWTAGAPADAETIVMWSAASWAFSREAETAYAPCRGGAGCREVAARVRQLGGRIVHEDRCGVAWSPEP